MSGKLCQKYTSDDVKHSRAYCEGRHAAAAAVSLVYASGDTGAVADDNALTWTSKEAGNGAIIKLADPGSADSALAVFVNGPNVIVSLATGASADIETGIEGNNNAITWTPARADGRLSVALVDPSGNDEELAITVTDDLISVSLATGAGGAITSTAAEVMAAVEADAVASALATVAGTGASTGAAAVVADTDSTGQLESTAAEVLAAVEGDTAADAVVGVADTSTSDGSGVAAVEAAQLQGFTGDSAIGGTSDAWLGGFNSYVGGVGSALPRDCCADLAYDGVP